MQKLVLIIFLALFALTAPASARTGGGNWNTWFVNAAGWTVYKGTPNGSNSTVTGITSGTSSHCRVGVALATGFAVGQTVTLSGALGAVGTACNGTTTISAINAAFIELAGTTFSGTYSGGGILQVCGGTASTFTGTCVFFVDPVHGVDATCQGYTMGQTGVTDTETAISAGAPSSPPLPCASTHGAQVLMRTGKPDWMLVLNGQPYIGGLSSNNIAGSLAAGGCNAGCSAINGSGRSMAEPWVFAGYGTGTTPPQLVSDVSLTTQDFGCSSQNSNRGQFIVILGFDCYNKAADPSDPGFLQITTNATLNGTSTLPVASTGFITTSLLATGLVFATGSGFIGCEVTAFVLNTSITINCVPTLGTVSNPITNVPIQITRDAKGGGFNVTSNYTSIAIEGNSIEFGSLLSLGLTVVNPSMAVRIRRNTCYSPYSAQARGGLCIFIGDQPVPVNQASVLIEQNVISTSGWNKAVWAAGANIFSHGMYLHNWNPPMTLNENIVYNSSSNFAQYRNSGILFNNLGINNPITVNNGPGANINPTNWSYNVFTEADDIQMAWRTANANSAVGQKTITIDGVMTNANLQFTLAGSTITDLSNPGAIPANSFPAAIVTITNASPAVVTFPNAFVGGEPLTIQCSGTCTLPSGITSGLPYYVSATGLTSTSFSFSTTPGGALINTTTAGSGNFTIISASAKTVFFNLAIAAGARGNGVQTGDQIAVVNGRGWGLTLSNGLTFFIDNNKVPEQFATPIFMTIGTCAQITDTQAVGLNEPFIIESSSGVFPGGIAGTTYAGAGASGTQYFAMAATASGTPYTFSTSQNGPCVNTTGSITGQLSKRAGWAYAGTTATYQGPATVTFNIGASTVTGNTVRYSGEAVAYSTTGTLPTGLTAGTIYYVVTGGLTYQVAATIGGTPITFSGTQSGTQTRLGPQILFFPPNGPVPTWLTTSYFLGQPNANNTYATSDGGTAIQSVQSGGLQIQTVSPSLIAIAGGEQLSLSPYIVGNFANLPPVNFGPNNIFTGNNSVTQQCAFGVNDVFYTQNIQVVGNYFYNWCAPTGNNLNVLDQGIAGQNVRSDVLSAYGSSSYPNASVEAYDATIQANSFTATFSASNTLANGYSGATMVMNSGTDPQIGDSLFGVTGVPQYTTVVAQIGSSPDTFVVATKNSQIANGGPFTMTSGSVSHFMTKALLNNKYNWDVRYTANANNNYIRSGQPGTIPCGNQTTFPGSPACPQQNWLLNRDIGGPANDNSPAFMNKAA